MLLDTAAAIRAAASGYDRDRAGVRRRRAGRRRRLSELAVLVTSAGQPRAASMSGLYDKPVRIESFITESLETRYRGK